MKKVIYKWFVAIVIVNLIACQTVETPEQLRIAISKAVPGKSYQSYIKWIKSVDTSISCIDMYHLGIDSAFAVMENCDGLLLTGGEDIFPGRYGKENDTVRCDKPDFYRDSLEFALIGKALELELPVLGICRGHQILNVYLGGSLIIDIPSDLDTIIKHRVKGTFDCFHNVTITENSILKDITNLSEGQVNSRHHQGVDILASDLKAIAKTKDGLTEAIQWDEPYGKSYLLGVQWHPERMDYANPLSNKIIQKFIAEIKKYSEIKSKKEEKKMNIIKENFGNIDNKEVYLFTIKNENGMEVNITNYGGIVTSILVPDKNGDFDDVVLGYDNLDGYLKETPYFGAIVGRYANRIAKGKFTLDEVEYILADNNGENHLHGGIKGLDKVVWDAEEFQSEDDAGVKLHYLSPDGEEGYPGNLDITVVYTLTNSNELKIEYSAKTDKPTPVNLTHHSYFNLAGTSGRDILEQILFIKADKYTVVNESLIPTGELRDVTGTPMDFKKPTTIGSRINEVEGGYDHNYILNNKGGFAKVTELYDPVSGRIVEVFTSEPGIQFYSGNFLDGSITGKKDMVYRKHFGLCLETQHFPDSPNQPDFPNTILRPGEEYKYTTVYKFSVR